MKKHFARLLAIAVSILTAVNCCQSNSLAEEDYMAEAENRKHMAVESNSIENWPVGPEIGAESAILIEANTGAVLYAKNIHAKLYPASVTKLLTALVAYDNCKMDEDVTFSYDAVGSIDWRYDANMGIDGGSTISMEQTLYGMLVGSANEAAYAIAEHVSGNGNLEDFAVLMNDKAVSLGCVDSHFVTPNGIHNENHYTSAYDLSLIARAFFSNDFLSRISCTPSYSIPQSDTQPKDNITVYAKSKLFPGKEYAYDGLVGTKTGYTDYARQTLVSCAERNNMKLICVVMKEEAPYQYTDTIDLFNYGFNNFSMISVADNDDTYNISTDNFIFTDNDLFGNSKPIVQIDNSDTIVIPIGSSIEKTVSQLSYDNLSSSQIARIDYYYSDVFVGSADIIPSSETTVSYDFAASIQSEPENIPSEDNTIFLNVINIAIYVIIGSAVLVALILLISFIRKKRKLKHRSNSNKSYNYKNKKLNWKNFK